MRSQEFWPKNSRPRKTLKEFSIYAILCSIDIVKFNIKYQEMACMLIGYVKNYTIGTYRMLNLRTKHIILIRDIIWLNKTYGEYVSRKIYQCKQLYY